MKVSIIQIIYPGTNKENFHKSIDSVLSQTYQNFEYIIIGESNENKTLEIPKNEKIKFINSENLVQKFEHTKEFKSKISRCKKKNLGTQFATGEIVYFIDDDFILDSKILENGVQKISEGFDMIAVHNTSDPTISIWSKVRKFERDMYKYDLGNISCRFTTKKIFEKVKGFNENLVAAEDYDIHNRMVSSGGKIAFIDPEEVHIGEPKSLTEIIKKHFYYGKTMAEFKKNGGNLTLNNASPIRSGFLKNWKKLLFHPLMTSLFIFYQIVKFGSGGLGFLSVLLKSKFSK